MDNVISIAAVRAEKLKQALATHSRNGDLVVVETRNGLISAEKITCRGRFAEILNDLGDYFVIDYADIRSLRPVVVAQHSVVNARGDFIPVHEAVSAAESVSVLPFAPLRHRR
jgi:hypothetical protein